MWHQDLPAAIASTALWSRCDTRGADGRNPQHRCCRGPSLIENRVKVGGNRVEFAAPFGDIQHAASRVVLLHKWAIDPQRKAKMTRDRSRREPAYQFVRYGVCQFDTVTDDSDAAALASAERLRAFEAAKSRIHRTWVELCAVRQPARRLPEPLLHSIPVSADKPTIRSAIKAATDSANSHLHLVRLMVHSGLDGELGTKELEKSGIQLLISVSPPSENSPECGWMKSTGAMAIARVTSEKLPTLIHDVVLDVWMGNFLDEPFASHIRQSFYEGNLFRSKVAFAVSKLNGSETDFGPVDKDSSYVTFASLARDDGSALNCAKYVALWQEFATSLAATRATPTSDPKAPRATVDSAEWCLEAARIVERGVCRSLKLSTLHGQLLVSKGKRLVVLVLLRPAVSTRQSEQLRGLGLRRLNSTAVLNVDSDEWYSLRGLVEDLRLMGRVAAFTFDRH